MIFRIEVELLYLRKRWAGQAFWDYAAHDDLGVPFLLRSLVATDRVPVGREMARRTLAYLDDLGFREDAPPNVRTPVELVDYFDRPVALAPAS